MSLKRMTVIAGLILLAGCTNGPSVAKNDPFLGEHPPIAVAPARPTGATAALPRTPSDPLKLPTPTAPATPASLAGGAPTESDLRIGVAPGAAKSPSPSSNDSPDPGPWKAAGVTLQPPEAIHDPLVQPASGVAPPVRPTVGVAPPIQPYVGGAPTDDNRQIQDELSRVGVHYQDLHMVEPGVWQFSCGVPSPHNSGLTRRYEAVAPGDNGQAAIRAVLDRIYQDRAGSAPR
jgi:hypothetical protein